MWCSPAQAFSGPVIEPIHGMLYLLCSDAHKTGPLWKVLTKQAVRVLVESALPRAVWFCKVDIRA